MGFGGCGTLQNRVFVTQCPESTGYQKCLRGRVDPIDGGNAFVDLRWCTSDYGHAFSALDDVEPFSARDVVHDGFLCQFRVCDEGDISTPSTFGFYGHRRLNGPCPYNLS